MWLGVLLLVGLAVFIVWDGRRLRRASVEPLSPEALRNGYTPNGLVTWHFWLGMGAVLALLGLEEWSSPSRPPFKGRWSWLSQTAYDAFGVRGVFVLLMVLSVAALACGLGLWCMERKRRSSAG